MSLVVSCRCGQSYSIGPEWAGQTLPCPRCQQPILIPAAPQPQPSLFDQPLGNVYQQPYQAPVAKSPDLTPVYWIAGGVGGSLLLLILGIAVYRSIPSPKTPAPRQVATAPSPPTVPQPPPASGSSSTAPKPPAAVPTPLAPPAAAVAAISPTLAQVPTTEIVDGWTRSITVDGRFEFLTPAPVIANTDGKNMHSIATIKHNRDTHSGFNVEFRYSPEGKFDEFWEEKALRNQVQYLLKNNTVDTVSINWVTMNGQRRLQFIGRKGTNNIKRSEFCWFDNGKLSVKLNSYRNHGFITDAEDQRFFDSFKKLK